LPRFANRSGFRIESGFPFFIRCRRHP